MKNKELQHAGGARSALTGLIAACAFAALVLAGCGGGGDSNGDGAVSPASSLTYAQRCKLAPAAADTLELPAPTGAHCIGKTVFHLVDPARDEPFTPDDPADRRELSVKAWYPVEPAGGRRADYLEPAILAEVKASLSIDPGAPDVAANAVAGGRLPAGARYPVVLFSPGYGGVVEGYSTLIEDLASHGVVVLAVDHPYVSGIAALASGRKVEVLYPEDPQQVRPVLQLAAQVTVDDLRGLVDWLQGEGTGVLRGGMDFARIGAYGHSIGGSAALQASRQDARIKAGLNMDGSVQGDTSGPWPRPLKIILAADHGQDPTIEATLNAASGMASTSTIPQTGHMDFGDLKLLLDFYVPGQAGKEAGLGAADAAEVIRATRSQVLSFFGQWVFR